MNSLEILIRTLRREFSDYIDGKAKYEAYIQQIEQETAKSSSPDITATANTLPKLEVPPPPIMQDKTTAKKSEAKAKTKNESEVATTTAAPIEVVETQSSPKALVKPQISMLNYASIKLTSTLGYEDAALAANKVVAAKMFVEKIDELLAKSTSNDIESCKNYLQAFLDAVDSRIKSADQLLKLHIHRGGEYDALLRVFQKSIVWLREQDNLKNLCVVLTHEADPKTLEIGLASQKEPIMVANLLVSYLYEQLFFMHLDNIKDSEAINLKYTRKLPEEAFRTMSPKIIEQLHSLSSYFSKFQQPKDRLGQVITVLGDLIKESQDCLEKLEENRTKFVPDMLSEKLPSFLKESLPDSISSTPNQVMQEFIARLESFHTEAKTYKEDFERKSYDIKLRLVS